MLVHVERKDRLAARQGGRVIHRPLVDELLIARRPAQQHPARTAAQRLADRREFGPPVGDAFEIPYERLAQGTLGLPARAERGKKELMQYHRIGCDQLFALETIDDEDRSRRKVELLQLSGDRIETLNRAAVIVVVVTADESFRHAFDPGWVTGKRLHLIDHNSSLDFACRQEAELGGRPLTGSLLIPTLGALCLSSTSNRHCVQGRYASFNISGGDARPSAAHAQ